MSTASTSASTPRMWTRSSTAVRYLGPSFGGINLEDIKAPECFVIEQRLRELMDIPVFHDDQHGTAIVAAAGLINAVHLTGRDLATTKLVINGAGAASIACAELVQGDGHAARERHPVRHQGRDLPRPHRGHEPVEVGACGRRPRRAPWPRRWKAPTCFFGPFRQGRGDAGDGPRHGAQADHLRHGQPRPGDHAGGGHARCGPTAIIATGRSATIRTRSTMCSASPSSSAARSTCAPRPSTTR